MITEAALVAGLAGFKLLFKIWVYVWQHGERRKAYKAIELLKKRDPKETWIAWNIIEEIDVDTDGDGTPDKTRKKLDPDEAFEKGNPERVIAWLEQFKPNDMVCMWLLDKKGLDIDLEDLKELMPKDNPGPGPGG